MRRKIVAIFIFIISIFSYHGSTMAGSAFDVYFLGMKVDSLRDYNWLQLTAGAVSSVLAHELGHALYLERSGKDWELRTSSSGLAIYTHDDLSDGNCKNLGRAGFALQTAIGTLLTSFEKTRKSDFTKGWVGINSVQLYTYNFRSHNDGDDFNMIERGGGNPVFDQNIFAMLSIYNISRLKPKNSKPIIPGYDIVNELGSGHWDDFNDEYFSNINSLSGFNLFNQDNKTD